MKFYFITIALVIQTIFGFGQIVNDDYSFFSYNYDKEILKKNKVASVIIEPIHSNGIEAGKLIFYFSEEGNLYKEEIFNGKGSLLKTFHFEINSYNDLISRIQIDSEYNRIDTVSYFKQYINNKLVKDSSSDIPISYTYEYNSMGKVFKTVIHSNLGLGNNTKRVNINKFDSLGRKVSSIETFYQNELDSIGTIFSDRYFIYNHEGNIEKEVERIVSEHSWLTNKGSIDYVYDTNGNLIQLKKTNGASYTFTHNDQGLIMTKKMRLKTEPDSFDDKGINMETFDRYSYTFRH